MNGGFPFYVSATDTSNTGAYHAQRANQVCSGKLSHPTAQKWFDMACFVNRASINWAMSGGTIWWDLGTRM